MARTGTEQIPSEETATVLLTAVERSTLLEATSHGAVAAVTRQYELVEAAMRAHGAVRSVRMGQHDGVFAVFRSSAGAVTAALAVQRALAAEQWPGGPVVRVGDRPAGLQHQLATQGRFHLADTGVKPI